MTHHMGERLAARPLAIFNCAASLFSEESREMQTALRVAGRSDADAIAVLVNRAYRPAPHERGWTHEADLISGARTSTEQVLSFFASGSCILVLCAGPKIVACVHLQDRKPAVHIGMLATDPSFQARGLGKEMLFHAEQYAAEHFNASMLKMSVVSSRPELLAFYERRGYARTGEIDGYPAFSGAGRPIIEGLQVVMLSKETDISLFRRS